MVKPPVFTQELLLFGWDRLDDHHRLRFLHGRTQAGRAVQENQGEERAALRRRLPHGPADARRLALDGGDHLRVVALLLDGR